MEGRILLARLLALGAFACGIIGLVAGLIDRVWKLDITGWFTGGTLLALLALIAFADQHLQSRQDGSG